MALQENLTGTTPNTQGANMLSKLYKLSPSNGKVQQWSVTTDGAFVIVTQGQVGGVQTPYRTESFGKNIGRANETTAAEQAVMEAKSKHAKKLKSGYTEDKSGEQSTKTPMKVNDYWKHKSKVQFPCYVSRKLNGVNAEERLSGTELTLLSRGGEEYPRIPHIEQSVHKLMADLGTNALNGELYIHTISLQKITSYVKKPKPESSLLEFHVFDAPNLGGTYAQRIAQLINTDYPHIVPAVLANSHEELHELHDLAVEQGYEGIIIRNADCRYEYNTRSNSAFKMKVAMDKEFQVVGYKLDKYGHPVYTCASDGGNFSVKRKGTSEQRLADAVIADSNVGLWLTVEFESYSDAQPGFTVGKPTKPVGLDFRLCDDTGNPLT